MRAQSRHQCLVHLAAQHHHRRIARLRIGHAQPGDELALLAHQLQSPRQLHAAAMHQRYLVAVLHQLRNRLRALVQQLRILEGGSSQLDDIISCQSLRFSPSAHQVQILHRLTGRAFQQVVQARNDHASPPILVQMQIRYRNNLSAPNTESAAIARRRKSAPADCRIKLRDTAPLPLEVTLLP